MKKLKHVLLFESYHGLSKSEIRELETVGVLPKWFEDPQEIAQNRPDLEVDEETGRIKSKTYGWVLDMAARTVTFEELDEEPSRSTTSLPCQSYRKTRRTLPTWISYLLSSFLTGGDPKSGWTRPQSTTRIQIGANSSETALRSTATWQAAEPQNSIGPVLPSPIGPVLPSPATKKLAGAGKKTPAIPLSI